MDPRNNEYLRRVQQEGMMGVARYLEAIFAELAELRKAVGKKATVKEEPVTEQKEA